VGQTFARLSKLLRRYTTALKNQPFRTIYMDGFAGTGYRKMRESDLGGSDDLLFPELAASAPQQLLDGSARLALQVVPRFAKYLFIDRDPEHCAALEDLKLEFPGLAAEITVSEGDANETIRRLCKDSDWTNDRAVLFLDPYGMQVEWQTIEAVAGTRAIDMWLLFPLGVAVNRLVMKSANIPESWRKCLTKLLGTDEWEQAFYHVEAEPSLFGGDEERIVKASQESIGAFFNDRLRKIFAGVAESPGVLRNSTGSPLYLLCFAAANPKGAPIALRIAEHILREVR
jgi:hypothetical protein